MIVAGHQRDDIQIQVPRVGEENVLDYNVIDRYRNDESHKVLVKVADGCCRENVGWVNIRNLVPAGLSHSETYLQVKNRKESPALEVAELVQLLAKWGLRDVMYESVIDKPLSG